jgi:hypothetical protein
MRCRAQATGPPHKPSRESAATPAGTSRYAARVSRAPPRTPGRRALPAGSRRRSILAATSVPVAPSAASGPGTRTRSSTASPHILTGFLAQDTSHRTTTASGGEPCPMDQRSSRRTYHSRRLLPEPRAARCTGVGRRARAVAPSQVTSTTASATSHPATPGSGALPRRVGHDSASGPNAASASLKTSMLPWPDDNASGAMRSGRCRRAGPLRRPRTPPPDAFADRHQHTGGR